jgi:hypothetical protein
MKKENMKSQEVGSVVTKTKKPDMGLAEEKLTDASVTAGEQIVQGPMSMRPTVIAEDNQTAQDMPSLQDNEVNESECEVVEEIEIIEAPGMMEKGVGALGEFYQKARAALFSPRPGVSPARQKTTIVLVPLLFIVFITIFSRLITGGASAEAKRISQEALATDIEGSRDKIDWQVPMPYPKNLRDPMRFDSSKPTGSKSGEPVITGILYSVDDPSAVVSDKIVRPGNMVGNARVVQIFKDGVEFEMNGKKWTQKVKR